MNVPLKEGFHYSGPLVATYVGSGALSTPTGGLRCNFRADQELDGSIQLVLSRIDPRDFVFNLISLFETPRKVVFRGTTDDGSTLSIDLFGAGNALSPDSEGYSAVYYRPEQFTIWSNTRGPIHPEFLLTNFAFTPFTHLGEPPALPPPHILELTIPVDQGKHVVELRPLPDYVSRIVALWQSKHVVPTTQMVMRTDGCTPAHMFRLAKKLCWLLSTASGTVVQWISVDGHDREKNARYRHHAARRTGSFGSMPVIPIREFGYQQNTLVLQTFLQSGLERLYVPEQEEAITRIIAAFLDARKEGDYSEARGIKTVVLLEMLKNLFVDRYRVMHWEVIMPKALRKRMVKAITEMLCKAGVSEETVTLVRETLGQLGHPHFKRILSFMLNELALAEDNEVVRHVVETRNSLVHYGQFLSTRDPEQAIRFGFGDAGVELFTLISFVDRLMIRILGYSGTYIDYSRSTTSTLRQVIGALPIKSMRTESASPSETSTRSVGVPNPPAED